MSERITPQSHVEIPAQPEPDDSRSREPKKSKQALAKARQEFAKFREIFEPLINGYFGTESIQFSMRPDGWYIDLEQIKVNADPNFFFRERLF